MATSCCLACNQTKPTNQPFPNKGIKSINARGEERERKNTTQHNTNKPQKQVLVISWLGTPCVLLILLKLLAFGAISGTFAMTPQNSACPEKESSHFAIKSVSSATTWHDTENYIVSGTTKSGKCITRCCCQRFHFRFCLLLFFSFLPFLTLTHSLADNHGDKIQGSHHLHWVCSSVLCFWLCV